MSISASPSIFDVFNARQLTPEQVANSFVPPPHFDKLVKPTHSLIIGPRGSGKTTLLKMLHPLAVDSWKHPQAEATRKKIDYIGVFIGADINWSEQVKALGDGRLDEVTHRQFAKAAFTTEILQSLTESMMIRFRQQQKGLEVEAKLCEELKDSWLLLKTVPTFDGISLALSKRLSDIRILASQEAHLGTVDRGNRLAKNGFLHLDFLEAASFAVKVYDIVCETRSKWAFLFDELELAPEWIRTILIRYLRSTKPQFLFKISISPYAVDLTEALNEVNSPNANDDFQAIRLWYVNKEQGYPFCRELLDQMQRSKMLPLRTPEEIFGESDFNSSNWREEGSAYHPNSRVIGTFKRLEQIDPTFRDYLRRRGIEINKIPSLKNVKRAADVRKARSIVALREYYRGQDSGGQRTQNRRSRKVPTVYGGASALFAMVEGNPRWFIGIIGDLLKDGAGVSKPAQIRKVNESCDVFRAMLRTIPVAEQDDRRRGLLSLLDPIGSYFSAAAIDGPFDPDPPCSFCVDENIETADLIALGKALNAGAIVYAPEDEDAVILSSLKGKRFRLSYLMAPHYAIPLVLGREITLSEIRKRTRSLDESQPSLFREEDTDGIS